MLSTVQPIESDQSPRTTIVVDAALMNSTLSVMNESNMASDIVATKGGGNVTSPAKETHKDSNIGNNPNPAPPAANYKDSVNTAHKLERKSDGERTAPNKEGFPPIPTSHEYQGSHLPGYAVNLTPQASNYQYIAYGQQQMTPEPPSPAAHITVTDAYGVGSFFHQPQTIAFGGIPPPSPFGNTGNSQSLSVNSVSNAHMSIPMSPPRGMMPTVATSAAGAFPPASPLFPRATVGISSQDATTQQRGAPPSPSMSYMMTPGSASNTSYQPYPISGAASRTSEDGTWGGANADRVQQSMYASNPSGMNMAYGGIPTSRAEAGGRAYSFDETLLQSSALDLQDQANPSYSPYSTSQVSAGGTLFAPPSWGYGAHPDMYSQSGSPLQPRPQTQIPMYPGMQGGGAIRQMGSYPHFYTASSPGPPIQTTASNKGPDGANLFIFHIPNHFTNLDMYQLFSAYGNLLSVRIMVEKDSGRSRGFGFVSYDTPDAAALAIKELNGFAIGNKRLKVQHKQIRSRDMHDRDSPEDSFLGSSGEINYPRAQFPSALPPPVPSANANLWSENPRRNGAADNEADPVNQQHENNREFSSGHDEMPGVPDQIAVPSSGEEQSALSTLSQIQNALPDISVQEFPSSN